MGRSSRRKKERRQHKARPRRDLQPQEVERILEKVKGALSSAEHETLRGALDTLAVLTRELESKGITVARLRTFLFGSSGVPVSDAPGAMDAGASDPTASPGDRDRTSPDAAATDSGDEPQGSPDGDGERKRKGHGRNGHQSYVGAERILIAHHSLKHGSRCPECDRGNVYEQAEPAVIVRVRAMAPVQATVWERQRLRCGACGEVYTAPAPEGVGEEKNDETVRAMVALLHYGAGMPLHRLEKLQGSLGIPLPAATAWEELARAAEAVAPAHAELVRQAAQSEVLYHDDTSVKVLEIVKEIQREIEAGTSERTGMFTSGIVATGKENPHNRIALFYTGRDHAGENLLELLRKREANRPPPIQMSDASSRNMPAELQTIVANCNAHGLRKFRDVESSFPDEVSHVLEILGEVYEVDDEAKKRELSAEERLRLHQERSAKPMNDLHTWLRAQLDDRLVEENSSLGGAIQYMLNHWEKLTRFLHVAGAPLDSNLVERALKHAIRRRKNSLFYKTRNGARVGDMFMALIHTTELDGGNPFEYLVALQRHAEHVARAPSRWMPWNYRETLAGLQATPPDAS